MSLPSSTSSATRNGAFTSGKSFCIGTQNGSFQFGNCIAEYPRRRSAIVRANGPCVDIIIADSPRGFGFDPPLGIRPIVGRKPITPLQNAGQRTEPATSFPWAIAHIPVATAAPAPPLEPPGVRCWPYGL